MQKIHADIIFQTVDPITDVYVGVPDSLLKNFLNKVENCGKKHIICANEAHAVSIAFGMMMAGKKPCVYLQNSGLGHIIGYNNYYLIEGSNNVK